eukprot:sb/3464640/
MIATHMCHGDRTRWLCRQVPWKESYHVYTKWKSYASNSARDYKGGSEDDDCGYDFWAYYRQNGDSTEFTALETPNYSGDTDSDPNTSPLIAGGANKLPIYWYMDQTETRKEDGFKLVFSHSATYFSGVGNFTSQMFREIPTYEESYMVSGTDPDQPFYFPHLLLMNDKSSVCIVAFDYGYPMRWKLNNNILEIEVYNLDSEFKLYFETADTPLEATTACISRWRDIYTNRQTNNVMWSDDFIAGTFNTSRIEELMNRAGVLPNMFILSPDEMSLSSDGETLLINDDTSLTDWSSTLLGWNARFKLLSGVDDDITEYKGWYVADNETEYFYSYNRSSWQPAQNRDDFGAAGYFLFDGTMMNETYPRNNSKSSVKNEGTRVISVFTLVGVGAGIKSLSQLHLESQITAKRLNIQLKISKVFLSGYSHKAKKRLCANLIIQLSNEPDEIET